MLTRKQHELVCFINDRLADSGVSPSFEEMKEALDLKSKSGVHRLISALEERGFLRRLPNRARALEVVKMPERPGAKVETRAKVTQLPPASARPAPVAANDIMEIPLHGRIAAGVPIEAFESDATDTAVNISGVDPITTRALVQLVLDHCGSTLEPQTRVDPPGTVRLTSGGAFHIPHERAARVIGWRPEVPMREGIRRLLAWRDAHQP